MKLSNLEMTEKSINVQENDKDVQENDMLLAEVRRQVNPLSFCACTHFVPRIQITPHRTSAEERQSRTQSPQAFWSAGRRKERLWDNGISYPRKRQSRSQRPRTFLASGGHTSTSSGLIRNRKQGSCFRFKGGYC